MMFGPSQLEPHERETGGIVQSFFLNFGLFLGVHAAVGVLYLLTGSIGFSI